MHNSRTEVIRLDRAVSPGIKNMAQPGITSPLSIELGNVISNGDGATLIVADKGKYRCWILDSPILSKHNPSFDQSR